MRDLTDLTKKSAAKMDSIFGVRADAYSLAPPPLPPLQVDPKRSTTLTKGGGTRFSIDKRKKRRRLENRGDNNFSIGIVTDNKKKRNSKSAPN